MKTSINSLHHQEGDWLRELAFYDLELSTLRKRLYEVKTKDFSKEEQQQLDDFLKQFLYTLQDQLNILQRENKDRYARVDILAKTQPENIENEFESEKDEMYQRMNDFATLFSQTRFYFNAFLSKLK